MNKMLKQQILSRNSLYIQKKAIGEHSQSNSAELGNYMVLKTFKFLTYVPYYQKFRAS